MSNIGGGGGGGGAGAPPAPTPLYLMYTVQSTQFQVGVVTKFTLFICMGSRTFALPPYPPTNVQ